jgi:hypothetical protein
MDPRAPVILLVIAFLTAGCITSTPEDEPGDEPAPVQDDQEAVTWGDASSAFIRPGAPIGWCTYNFLFVDPAGENETGTPTYYIGTAAHCVDDVDDRMPLAGHGEIGEVAFTSYNDTFVEDYNVRRGVDFALIRLDPGMNLNAHPQMMNTEGPTGYTTAEDVALGDELEHHGYGMVFGEVEPLRDRPGWIVSYGQDFCSESVVWWGDSGSPVLHKDTGKALGIVSRAGWVECTPVSQLAGATVEHILDELAKTPWSNVRLVLADGTYKEARDGGDGDEATHRWA